MRGAAWVVAMGCVGGKTTDEGPHCEETRTPIALDEATPLGFTAQELLARLPASENPLFTYEDGTTTNVALTFTPGADGWLVDSFEVYPDGTGPAIAPICEDYVEIELAWTLQTTDGVLDEAVSSPLRATALESGRVTHELDLTALGGTLVIDDYTDTTDYDEARLWVDAAIGDGATSGAVHGQISGTGDCSPGDTCTAWAGEVSIGTWGLATER